MEQRPILQTTSQSISQRAMAAARVVNRGRGGANPEAMSIDEAAAAHKVSPAIVGQARSLLKHASPEQIREIDAGQRSIGYMLLRVKNNNGVVLTAPSQRPLLRVRTTKESSTGSSLRHETLRVHNVIWNHLRNGLNEIANLPRPQDVAELIRTRRGGDSVHEALVKAINHLEEIERCLQSSKN